MTSDLGGSSVPRRFPALCSGVLMIGVMLAPTAAPAFTFEDGGDKWAPKFDIEEQARQFSTPNADASAVGKRSFETPIGTMQFGVQRVAPGYGSPYGPSFDSRVRAQQDRRHLDRMLTPIPAPDDGR